MSLINEALIKAERDRTEAAIAEANRLDPLTRAQKRQEQRRRQSLGPILTSAALLGVMFAGIIAAVVWHRPVTIREDAVEPPDALVERPSPTELAATPAPLAHPLGLEAEPTAARPPPRTEYALAGMSTLGQETLLSIVRQSDRRSVWVPVGKSVGEITAVSYDENADTAVIRVGAREMTIRMGSTAQAAE